MINIDVTECRVHAFLYFQDAFDDTEFPENLEDFVTLDELDSTAGEAGLGTAKPQE